MLKHWTSQLAEDARQCELTATDLQALVRNGKKQLDGPATVLKEHAQRLRQIRDSIDQAWGKRAWEEAKEHMEAAKTQVQEMQDDLQAGATIVQGYKPKNKLRKISKS